MRILPAGLAVALMLGIAPITRAGEVVVPSSVPITQTIVTLAAGIDTTLGSSTNRRYFCLMNIGTGLVNLGFDQAAVASSGWALGAAGQIGDQGGSMCWESSVITGSMVHAISSAGSLVAVLEGR